MLAWPLCHWTCPGSSVRSQELAMRPLSEHVCGHFSDWHLQSLVPATCSTSVLCLLPGAALAPRTSHRHSRFWRFMQTALLSFSATLKIQKPFKGSSKSYCLFTAIPGCHKHSQKLLWSQNLCRHLDPQTHTHEGALLTKRPKCSSLVQQPSGKYCLVMGGVFLF